MIVLANSFVRGPFLFKTMFFPFLYKLHDSIRKDFAKHPVKNLKELEKIDSLPLNLRHFCEKCKTSEDLYSEMLNNEAALHKSCSLLYNKENLTKKVKVMRSHLKTRVQILMMIH